MNISNSTLFGSQASVSSGSRSTATSSDSPSGRASFLAKNKAVLSIVLGLSYAFLFHHGEVGLNVLLFDALLLFFFLKTQPELKARPLFAVAAAGLLFSAISVVIVNTWLASAAHIISLLLTIGVARVREIRFIWFGFLLGIISFFRGPVDLLMHWRDQVSSRRENPDFRLRYVLIPGLIVLPFLFIYALANPAIGRFFGQLTQLGQYVSLWTIATLIWGCLLGAFMLFPRHGESLLAKIGASFRDDIPRRGDQQNIFLQPFARPKIMGLKHEYELARGTFLALNGLLLIVNLTDLGNVWLGSAERTAAELSQFVHSGTYLLIASILMAMLVVIVFFRGLLNFYPRVPELRRLSFLWIGQNALLALSVGIRNGLYIGEYGLAWGRVQVFFFLLLILIGLYTLYRKVDGRLSLTYLLHNNGLAAWLCFLALAAVNWDGVITRYNLAYVPTERLDRQHILSYELEKNAFLLADREILSVLLFPNQPETSSDMLWQNRPYKLNPHHFIYHDWRSWNYADWRGGRRLRGFERDLGVE
ncbi:hypothetical protein CEQ90_11505 [Lewinellaceae bacterium SD302]|nr:hypothetical protein CEQ90_11505 [Lewinellaceae bacterium SD302]